MISLDITTKYPKINHFGQKEFAGLRKAAGNKVMPCLKEHLEALQGRSYYRQAAASVAIREQDDELSVVIPHRGLRVQVLGTEKALGHPIMPVRAKLLSIPAHRGIRQHPRFYDLVYIKIKWPKGKAKAMLIKKDESAAPAKKGEKKPLNVYFWLVEEVTIRPHPYVMPSMATLTDAALRGAESYLKTLSRLQ